MQPHQDRAPRRLTHDERKAAEAALQGWAFNEAWSQAALNVYNGIRLAQMKLNHERLISWSGDAERHPVGAAESHYEDLSFHLRTLAP